MTFGEIMARFSPPGNLRLDQAMPGSLDITFAGCEASVAVSYAILGGKSFFVSSLPKNSLTNACVSNLKSYGVRTNHIIISDAGRLGTYYLETGSNQRASKVEYDRDGSSISLLEPIRYNWKTILNNKAWLHVSGITPAISKNAFEATLLAVITAKEAGLTVSCDLNFRNKLWKWNSRYSSKELARLEMPKILRHVDMIIGNEQDADDVLDIELADANFEEGSIKTKEYPKIADQINEKFPNINFIAIPLRESISANHNRWGAMIYNCENKLSYFSPKRQNTYCPFEITDIVDRLGAGDSFAAALIFSMNHLKLDYKDALDFAVAASCIAHSIKGDYNITTVDEVRKLADGFTSGRVIR